MVERRHIAVTISYFISVYSVIHCLFFFRSYSFAKCHPPTSGRQGQVKDIFRCLNFLICLSLTVCSTFSTNLEACLSKKTGESGPWPWKNTCFVREACKLMHREATLVIKSWLALEAELVVVTRGQSSSWKDFNGQGCSKMGGRTLVELRGQSLCITKGNLLIIVRPKENVGRRDIGFHDLWYPWQPKVE